MSDHKVLVRIPDTLLNDFDVLAQQRGASRTETIREAMRFYLKFEGKVILKETDDVDE